MTNEPTSELDAMPLEQLSEDEQQQMIETYRAFEESEHARDEDISRRGVLAAIGTLIGGSAIGGGAVALSTKEVEAAVAAAGQVGTPSSPVDVYAKTVDTDDLDIASADFIASGDFVPLAGYQPYEALKSFTNTSYQTDTSYWNWRVSWDMFPPDAQIAIRTEIYVLLGTDESVSVRLRNANAGQTIHEQTGITSSQKITLGATNYTPPTTSQSRDLRLSWKTDTGANSSELQQPISYIGIQL